MPTYRYSGPHDAKVHEVVADAYERDDDNFVSFLGVASVDGEPTSAHNTLAVRVVGEIEEAD